MNRRIGMYLFVILLALLLGACGQDSSTPEPVTAEEVTTDETTTIEAGAEEVAPEKGSLIGTAWQLEFMGDPENPVPVLENTRPTFNILFEQYSGFGGCNMYTAGFVVGGPDEMRLNAPVTTRRACTDPEGVMEQEGSFIGAMANTVSVRLEDENLVLYTVGDQRLLTLKPAETMDMAATTWLLQFLSDGEGLMPVLPNVQVTAQFADGVVAGSAGCNEYTGTVEVDEVDSEGAAVSDVTATEMACEDPNGIMEQETVYLTELELVAGYHLVGSTLLLFNADGDTILLYSGQ